MERLNISDRRPDDHQLSTGKPHPVPSIVVISRERDVKLFGIPICEKRLQILTGQWDRQLPSKLDLSPFCFRLTCLYIEADQGVFDVALKACPGSTGRPIAMSVSCNWTALSPALPLTS